MLHREHHQKLGSFQPPENGIEGGSGYGDVWLDVLDYLAAIGIFVFYCGEDAYVLKPPPELNAPAVPQFA